MITYLDDIIGFEYADNPAMYILCFLLVVWLLYMLIQFLYTLFGVSKK